MVEFVFQVVGDDTLGILAGTNTIGQLAMPIAAVFPTADHPCGKPQPPPVR